MRQPIPGHGDVERPTAGVQAHRDGAAEQGSGVRRPRAPCSGGKRLRSLVSSVQVDRRRLNPSLGRPMPRCPWQLTHARTEARTAVSDPPSTAKMSRARIGPSLSSRSPCLAPRRMRDPGRQPPLRTRDSAHRGKGSSRWGPKPFADHADHSRRPTTPSKEPGTGTGISGGGDGRVGAPRRVRGGCMPGVRR